MHRYAIHLEVEAADDRAANARQADITFALRHGLPILQTYVTDADDWGEHIDDNERCSVCHEPVDRERAGIGVRIHATCTTYPPYPIQE